MKKTANAVRLGVLVLLLGTAAGQALAGAPVAGPAPSLDPASDRAVAVVKTAGLPGELIVTDPAGAERAAAFGMADRAANKPNRVGQRWLWASVTKQVTATLVMQEVARDRMALEAPIGRYLPDFGGDRAITVRELLQHRSGRPMGIQQLRLSRPRRRAPGRDRPQLRAVGRGTHCRTLEDQDAAARPRRCATRGCNGDRL